MAEERDTAGRVTRRTALWAAGGAGLAGAMAGAGAIHSTAAGGSGDEIVGTWLNPRTRNGGVSLATFTADGGWSNVHPDRNRSPAHGTWERVGDRTFIITRWSLRFDDDGGLIGTTKTRAESVVDADGYGLTSRRISEYFDLDGNLLGASPLIESRAMRVRAEPPR